MCQDLSSLVVHQLKINIQQVKSLYELETIHGYQWCIKALPSASMNVKSVLSKPKMTSLEVFKICITLYPLDLNLESLHKKRPNSLCHQKIPVGFYTQGIFWYFFLFNDMVLCSDILTPRLNLYLLAV